MTFAATIQVNLEKRFQTIEGFGASGAWWSPQTAQWKPGALDEALDLLFTDRGASLSIFRYNIGAGGGEEIRDTWRRAICVETEPGKYDLSRDQAALDVVRKVRQRGVERFVLFSNSPPPRLTRTGMSSGGEKGNSNLKPSSEAEFARFLVDISEKIQSDLQLPHVTLSPINEPQWKWGEKGRGQEGCYFTPQEVAATTRAVIEELRQRQSNVLLDAPECARWGHEAPDYLRPLLGDDSIHRYLSTLAIHSYFSNRDEKIALTKIIRELLPDIRIAQTEWCAMQHGKAADMKGAMDLAKVMHDDLTIANCVSWQFWLAVSRYDYCDGLVYFDDKTGAISTSKRLYAMGNYSRWIKPGAVRVEATVDESSLLTTAYLSHDAKSVIIVITNPTDQSVECRIDSKTKLAKSAETLSTSSTQSADAGHADINKLSVAPMSIVTLKIPLL